MKEEVDCGALVAQKVDLHTFPGALLLLGPSEGAGDLSYFSKKEIAAMEWTLKL